MAAVLFTLCLVLATSAAMPHGDSEKLKVSASKKLKESASNLLAFTEGKGGQIFSEVLLGRHVQNGKVIYDPELLSDLRAFLQEVLFQLTTFKMQVASSAESHEDQARRGPRGVSHLAYEGVVLPRDSNLQFLSYNDILDIIGDYTKGFVNILVPSPLPFTDRDVLISQLNALVDKIVDEIKEIENL